MNNMSFMLTTEQICNRTKTVTRRLGWRNLKPGLHIAACKKCMGLKKGETIERIAVLWVRTVIREPLCYILDHGIEECAREGFPYMEPERFVDFFCASHKGCKPDSVVTRIEFDYVDLALASREHNEMPERANG